VKGNRDDIEGKAFIGIGDTFEPDGGSHRAFSTLWWEAGRYLEIIVNTADEPLTIDSFSLRETRYPHEWSSRFKASDPRLADVIPIARRTLGAIQDVAGGRRVRRVVGRDQIVAGCGDDERCGVSGEGMAAPTANDCATDRSPASSTFKPEAGNLPVRFFGRRGRDQLAFPAPGLG